MVPMGITSFPVYFSRSMTSWIVSSTKPLSRESSERAPTRGIMISGRARMFSRRQAMAASVMAVTCMTAISGYVMASRHPR